MSDKAPGPYRVGLVMEAWQQARNRILTEDTETEIDEAELTRLLGDEQIDTDQILDRLLRASVHAQDMATMAEARAVEITQRRDRYLRRAEGIRTSAYHVMEAMQLRKRELPDLTATVRAGSASVFIINEDLLPNDCWRTVPEKKEPDKRVISERLKAHKKWEDARDTALAAGLDPDTYRTPLPRSPAHLCPMRCRLSQSRGNNTNGQPVRSNRQSSANARKREHQAAAVARVDRRDISERQNAGSGDDGTGVRRVPQPRPVQEAGPYRAHVFDSIEKDDRDGSARHQ